MTTTPPVPDRHEAAVSPTHLRLDAGRYAPVEITCAFICALAWPEDPLDGPDFHKRFLALVAQALRTKAESNQGWASIPQPVRPRYLQGNSQEHRASIANIDHRLLMARKVAWVGGPFVREVAAGQQHDRPSGQRRQTLMDRCRAVVAPGDMAAAKNFRRRVFEPSKPVLHLALALESLVASDRQVAQPLVSLIDQAWEPGVAQFLVKLAAGLADHVLNTRQFRVDASKQLQLDVHRWPALDT